MYCTLVFWHFTPLFFRFNMYNSIWPTIWSLFIFPYNHILNAILYTLKKSKTFSTEMKKLCEFNFCAIFIFVAIWYDGFENIWNFHLQGNEIWIYFQFHILNFHSIQKNKTLTIMTVFGFILRNCPRKYLWHLILQSEFQFWQYIVQWKNISENIWDKKMASKLKLESRT